MWSFKYTPGYSSYPVTTVVFAQIYFHTVCAIAISVAVVEAIDRSDICVGGPGEQGPRLLVHDDVTSLLGRLHCRGHEHRAVGDLEE